MESDSYKEALWHFNRALGVGYELFGDNADQTAAMGKMFVNLGDTKVKLVRYKDAESDYDRALSTYSQVYGDAPVNKDMAKLYNSFGVLKRLQCDFAEAANYHSKTQDMLNELSSETQGYLFCKNLVDSGDVMVADAKYDLALSSYGAAMQHTTRLIGDVSLPENQFLSRMLARIYCKCGSVRIQKAQFVEASQDYEKAKEITSQYLQDYLVDAEIEDGLGHLYLARGYYAQANEYYNGALNFRDEFYGGREIANSYIGSYINQGHCALKSNTVDRAIELCGKAYRVATQIYGQETALAAEFAKIYNFEGLVCSFINNFSKALARHFKSLGVLLQCYSDDTNHSDIADTYQHIADVYCELNDYDRAHEYNYKSLSMNKAIHPQNLHHISIASNHDTTARIYLGQGESHQALVYFTKSLDSLKISYHENAKHTDIIRAMNSVAFVHGESGQYEIAKEGHTQAIEDAHLLYQPGVHIDEVKSIRYLGDLEFLEGNYEPAIVKYKVAFEKALVIQNDNNCTIAECARARMMEGRAWHKLHGADMAEICYSEAKDLLRKIIPDDHAAMAAVNHYCGDLFASNGGHIGALFYYQAALAARQVIYKEFLQRRDIAENLHAVADCFGNIGQHVDSLNYHKKGLSITETIYEGMNHMALVDSYDGVATAYQSLRSYQKALPYFEKSLEMRVAIFGANSKGKEVIEGYTKLGHFYDSKQEYKTALEYFTKALDMTNGNHVSTRLERAKCYDNVGITNCNRGECYQAINSLETSLRLKMEGYALSIEAVIERDSNEPDQIAPYHKLSEWSEKLYGRAIAQTHCYMGNSYYADGVSLHHSGANEGVRRDKLRKALEHYDHALQNYQKAYEDLDGEHLDMAIVYNNKGLVLQRDAISRSLNDNYQSALENAFNALNIRLAVYEVGQIDNHPDISVGHLNLGDVLNLRGEYDTALEHLNLALEKLHSYYGENTVRPETASVYESIGTAYYYKTDYDQALTNYLKSHQMRTAICGGKLIKYNAELASINENLSNVYEKLGRHKESKRCREMVRKITIRSSDMSGASVSTGCFS